MAFRDGSRWQYRCHYRKAWVDLCGEEDRQLKEAFLALKKGGPKVVIAKIGTLRFQSDFEEMQRTNLASKRCSELRLNGGELPFSFGRSRSVVEEEQGIAPCELERGHAKVPHQVRKAWGQGVEEGITMSGEFEFSVEFSEKELFGEMLSWNMLSAGILPQALDNRCLTFTNKQGEVARGNKQEIGKMMASPKSYPIRVSYKPHPAFRYIEPNGVIPQELMRSMLRYTKEALKQLDHDLDKVKHKHQRRTFERYLLYLEDHHYQTGDDLVDAMDIDQMIQKYPQSAGAFNLINKTAPGLPKILKGEIDVLEYLFGG